jgi:hypothetical protein
MATTFALGNVGDDLRALIVAAPRRDSFTPPNVAELRVDEPPNAGMTVSVVADGYGISERRVPILAATGAVSVELPTLRPPPHGDVWAHRPTRDED